MQIIIEPAGLSAASTARKSTSLHWAAPPSLVPPTSSQTSKDAGWPTCRRYLARFSARLTFAARHWTRNTNG